MVCVCTIKPPLQKPSKYVSLQYDYTPWHKMNGGEYMEQVTDPGVPNLCPLVQMRYKRNAGPEYTYRFKRERRMIS